MKFYSISEAVSYEAAKSIQMDLLDLRSRGLISDSVLFLEHRPVITRGRGLQFTGKPQSERHMPLPQSLPEEIEFCESERGGDLTYHGPGQLVIYPIFKLDGRGFSPKRDITAFLRKFEDLIIDELAHWGLRASRKDKATGVWVGDRKIASMGIAVKKWVTYHGAAINILNDLSPFHLISPCGFSPEVMTRVADLVPHTKLSAAWPVLRARIEERMARAFFPAQRSPDIRRVEIPVELDRLWSKKPSETMRPGLVASAGGAASASASI